MKKTFSADIAYLHELQLWISDFVKKQKSNNATYDLKLELIVEEVFMNIIKHGYEQKGGHVDVELIFKDTLLTMIFTDWGKEFDPTTLRKGKEGGCGLILIHGLVDDIFYERKEKANILILRKHIIY
jgi:anti-sigma regulatory factor (Ser/Thr protein kinase)